MALIEEWIEEVKQEHAAKELGLTSQEKTGTMIFTKQLVMPQRKVITTNKTRQNL